MAARPGLEPGLTEPEPVVLPLHHQAEKIPVWDLIVDRAYNEIKASGSTIR